MAFRVSIPTADECSNCFERLRKKCNRPFKLEYLALGATIKCYIDQIKNENKEFDNLLCPSKWKDWVFRYQRPLKEISLEDFASAIRRAFQKEPRSAEKIHEASGDVHDEIKNILSAEEIISLILEKNTNDNPQRKELFECIDKLTTYCYDCFCEHCEKCGHLTYKYSKSKKFHGHYSFCTEKY